jgi:hypothetical protein
LADSQLITEVQYLILRGKAKRLWYGGDKKMNQNGVIPRKLEEKVRRELKAGELIQWIGQPVPQYFTARTTVAFLFAIPCLLVIFLMIAGSTNLKIPDLSQRQAIINLLMLLWFFGAGLIMLTKTIYAITDQRAIIMNGGWRTTVRSFLPDRLANIDRHEMKNGLGEVIFEREKHVVTGMGEDSKTWGFINIRNAREVEEMLKQLAAQGAGAPESASA